MNIFQKIKAYNDFKRGYIYGFNEREKHHLIYAVVEGSPNQKEHRYEFEEDRELDAEGHLKENQEDDSPLVGGISTEPTSGSPAFIEGFWIGYFPETFDCRNETITKAFREWQYDYIHHTGFYDERYR